MTFIDVERLFMKLMKGATEEDWIFSADFERDDNTRIYDHKIRSVYNAESLPWTWRYILTRFNRKHILCGRSLPCADRAKKCLDELCWKIEWKHHFLEKVSEMLPFRVPYQRTAVFISINFLVPLSVAGHTVPRVLCFQFCKRTVPEVRVRQSMSTLFR